MGSLCHQYAVVCAFIADTAGESAYVCAYSIRQVLDADPEAVVHVTAAVPDCTGVTC